MQINETYSASYKNGEWTLIETYQGTDAKTKEPKTHERKFYFGKLTHLIQSVINRMAGNAESLEELKQFLEEAPERVLAKLDIQKP